MPPARFCVVRQLFNQKLFLYRYDNRATHWTRHPSRAYQFASMTEARAVVPSPSATVTPVLVTPQRLTRPQLLEAIATLAADLYHESRPHDATSIRLSKRKLYELGDLLGELRALGGRRRA